MRDSDFTKLIKKAANLANEHREAVAKIDEESTERYGYYPSEIDCDEIIDSINYGAKSMSAEEFGRCMREGIKTSTDCYGEVQTN
jgi:hypothetical protein